MAVGKATLGLCIPYNPTQNINPVSSPLVIDELPCEFLSAPCTVNVSSSFLHKNAWPRDTVSERTPEGCSGARQPTLSVMGVIPGTEKEAGIGHHANVCQPVSMTMQGSAMADFEGTTNSSQDLGKTLTSFPETTPGISVLPAARGACDILFSRVANNLPSE